MAVFNPVFPVFESPTRSPIVTDLGGGRAPQLPARLVESPTRSPIVTDLGGGGRAPQLPRREPSPLVEAVRVKPEIRREPDVVVQKIQRGEKMLTSMFLAPENGGPLPFVHGRIGAAIGGFFSGGPAGAIAGALTGGGGGSRASVGADRGAGLGGRSCPPGTSVDNSGRCATVGLRGELQRFLPRGETGFVGDVFGEAVMGAFGIPAVVPAQVGTIQRKDGSVGPILRCPNKTVLGADNLCYMKGSVGRFRKWPRGTRPFLTGGDVKCLRRANTLRRSKGSKRLLRELGMG